MNYLISFLFLIAVFTSSGQTCTRLKYEMVTTVNGMESRGSAEIVTCGDKSVSSSKTGGISYKYVINPAEKKQLMLLDDGASYKTGTVIPIIETDSISEGPYRKIRDEDFHFTGKMKTIAGYECEAFSVELPAGGIATGYLARGVQLGIPSSVSTILQTNLGVIMECQLTKDKEIEMVFLTTVTSIETGLSFDDSYFSTEVPVGYSDMMQLIKAPHE